MTAPPSIQLDRRSDVPLQRQMFECFRKAILDGTLAEGTRLPATRDLAHELRVSRNCVVNAFRYLAAQGLVTSRTGAGTHVAPLPQLRARVPPSTRSRRGRAGRLASIVTDVSTGTAGAFRPGVPAIDLFPLRAWRAIVARQWRNPMPLLAYGGATGLQSLREAIAAHIGAARGVRCTPEQVLIVNGAQQAIDLAARVLLDPGDAVCVEEPCYPGARSAFAATGARVVPSPLDDEGLIVAAARERSPKPRLVYVTPSHQYPIGSTMSLARRQELVAWCAESGAWILEDDYGSELRHDGQRELPAVHALARNAAVIYTGTFSHLLAPSLRLGFAVVPHDLLRAFQVVAALAGRGPSTIEQAALAEFIADGHLERHLRRQRSAYAEREALLVSHLRALDAVESIHGLGAGSHLVVRLKKGIDESRVAKLAAANGIEVPFAGDYGNARGLILGYGSTDAKAIRDGMSVLAAAISRVRAR
jgi:GntR family transcriptional regulator/MocR family aminotransferase